MTIETVQNMQTPIGEILQRVGGQGMLLQAQGKAPFAIMPLDDDLMDFLIERNPKFVEDCREIRERMAKGQFHSQDEIDALFGRKTAP